MVSKVMYDDENTPIPREWVKYSKKKMATIVLADIISKIKSQNKAKPFPPKSSDLMKITFPKEKVNSFRITVDKSDLETIELINKLFGEEIKAKLEGAQIVVQAPPVATQQAPETVKREKETITTKVSGVAEVKPLVTPTAPVKGQGEVTTQAPAQASIQPVAQPQPAMALVPAEIKTEKIEIIKEEQDELLSSKNPEEYYENLEKKIQELIELYVGKKRSKVIEDIKAGKLTYDIYEFPEVFNRKIPTARVRIMFSEDIGEFRYVIYDYMHLSGEERKYYEMIRDAMLESPNYVSQIVELLNLETGDRDKFILDTTIDWINYLWTLLKVPYQIGSPQYTKILVNLLRYFVGYRNINYLFADKKNIEDVTYVGVQTPIFVRYKPVQTWAKVFIYNPEKKSVEPLTFKRVDEANDFVRLLSQKANQYVNVAKATADGRLPDGSRLHAKYGAVYTDPRKGSVFTIRFKSESIVLPLDLIIWKTIPPLVMAYGWITIENVDTASLLVVGGTGVGKTTTLQSLLLFVPEDKKILTIEDTPELELPHDNWEANYFDSGKPEQMVTLLKGALRSRPDYIVVQEVRGAEAEIMFQAMASGHAGLSTFHAGSFDKLIYRLTTKPIDLPEGLLTTLRQVWIQKWVTDEAKNLVRRITEIDEVANVNGKVTGIPLFKYNHEISKIEPTEYFYTRVYDPDSVMFKAMVSNGFKRPEELFIEIDNRAFFLRSLADLYNVYKKRNDIQRENLDPYQREAFDRVINFWEFYKYKVAEKLKKSFRNVKPNMYHVFFQLLFEYKYNPNFFKDVLKLANETIPPLLEVLK